MVTAWIMTSRRRSSTILATLTLLVVTADAAGPCCLAAMEAAYPIPNYPNASKKPNSTAVVACQQALNEAGGSMVCSKSTGCPVANSGCNSGDEGAYCRGAAPNGQGPQSKDIPNPGRSTGMPKVIDCAVRTSAWTQAKKLQGGFRSAVEMKWVFDALGIEEDCGAVFAFAAPPASASAPAPAASAGNGYTAASLPKEQKGVLFVDATHGNDGNAGTITAPLATVGAAVKLAVAMTTIYLRRGTYYLTETIELQAGKHDGLTVSAYQGEDVTVSGGVPLPISKWTKVATANGAANVWSADVTATLTSPALASLPVVGLFVQNSRAIRARWPNSNPEEPQTDANYVMAVATGGAQTWSAPLDHGASKTYTSSTPNRRTLAPQFGDYNLGYGGACSIYAPPESYWCSNHTSGGGAFTFRVPSGLTVAPATATASGMGAWDPTRLGKSSAARSRAMFNVYRPSRWSNWMFAVDDFEPKTKTFSWSHGGFQGARGDDFGGDWFIENVKEALDSPREFYYETEAGKVTLFYAHNDTSGGAPPTQGLVVPALTSLISVKATQAAPVKNIAFTGIRFTHTAASFMDPHGVPSGGDWALQRSAALFFEGVDGVNVTKCTLWRLDGNGVMLSGYVRNAEFTRNDFAWIADTAIASWGRTKQAPASEGGVSTVDGTEGNQPRGTLIKNNFIRELGFYQKQR